LGIKTKLIQGWQYGKGRIYFRPIFQLTKLAFLRAALKKKKKATIPSWLYNNQRYTSAT